MEKLTVRNFINLQSVDFEISRINIIIGYQATGKSLISKLVYFFKSFFLNYKEAIVKQKTRVQFDKDILEKFELIFPRYTWEKQEFSLIYQFHDYQISIEHNLYFANKFTLKLSYSDLLKEVFNKLKRAYAKKSIPDITSSMSLENILDFKDHFENFISLSNQIEKTLYEQLFKTDKVQEFDELTFIPAGRSFFANLQKNVFSFLSSNMPIDYFLKEFGSTYEKVKEMYTIRERIFKKHNFSELDALIHQIIVGKYLFRDGQDWIYSEDDTRINLANASSGQQESLPMAVILTTLPFASASHLFVIEEPEAHLFPISQKNIINLISSVFNLTNKRHKFIVTTHSPYILTAFNNLIQANNSLQELNIHQDKPTTKVMNALYKLVPKNQILDIADVRAYTLQDGKLTSIINEESKLIDINIIDEVSTEFNLVFEKLLELEYES
jgi:predicted ATPase